MPNLFCFHAVTRAALGELALLALLVACSGGKVTAEVTTTHEACEVFCDTLIECSPTWALEQRNRENCSWKFGDEAARGTCMKSCEWEEVESFDEEDEVECLLCIVDEVGRSCRSRVDATESCPCMFDVENYGGAVTPEIEPLACDGGDEYLFGSNTSGPENRERCLSGDTTYCW